MLSLEEERTAGGDDGRAAQASPSDRLQRQSLKNQGHALGTWDGHALSGQTYHLHLIRLEQVGPIDVHWYTCHAKCIEQSELLPLSAARRVTCPWAGRYGPALPRPGRRQGPLL